MKEDYVNFEVAKLLREKGFDKECSRNGYYVINKYGTGVPWNMIIYNVGDVSFEYSQNNVISRPTLQMAVKWLKETHNILIIPDYEYECDSTPYLYKIYRLGENGKPEKVAVKGVSYDKDNNPIEQIVGYRDYERSHKDYSTLEEAINDGIKYCLEQLI